MAIESNSEKRDSVQTNKMNKDPYHYPCESSLETLAQHLPVLISASPIFTELPASQKLKLVFTNKKYDKKFSEGSKAPILACCTTDVFFSLLQNSDHYQHVTDSN